LFTLQKIFRKEGNIDIVVAEVVVVAVVAVV
jgi:hypothetical protein